MSVVKRAVSAIKRIGILAAIAGAFMFGLAGTVYLSLRSPEVQVPEVVGQHYTAGQSALEETGLKIRKRAKRFKADAPPDTILDQSPHAGVGVKKGQTIAVVVSDENSGKGVEDGEEADQSTDSEEKPAENRSSNRRENTTGRNDNQQSNRRSNKNDNRNANRAPTNNSNSGRQAGANRNVNANTRANENRQTNNRSANRQANANGDSNRNANANRSNINSGNRNRRVLPSPPIVPGNNRP